MRKALVLSYNGTKYHGWQIQPNAPSVQEKLESVFCQLNRNNRVELVGCGRTDKGVHAAQFVAHFEVTENLIIEDLLYKINIMLPSDIAIRTVLDVDNEFHARFDAVKRHYEYHIHFNKDPFLNEFSWYYPKTLDLSSMKKACSQFIGKKNFQSFSKSNTQVKNFICEVSHAEIQIYDDRLILEFSANRFLRNMVRAMVGTLIRVGEGKIEVADIANILKTKDRSNAGESVPAHGLYLSQIDYPSFSSLDYYK